jgi:hypothetical protein
MLQIQLIFGLIILKFLEKTLNKNYFLEKIKFIFELFKNLVDEKQKYQKKN